MTPELASSHAFCARVARSQARNFYPSFLLLPADRRRSMCALYAFLRRTDDIADGPGTIESKSEALAAWRAGLGRALATGGAVGAEGPDWPGWPALADTVVRHAVPSRYLDEVLDGVAMDLEPRRFSTFDELHGYCHRVATAVGLCCLHVWGYRSDGGRAEALAEAAGQALQLTNIIRDVAEDARGGRIYLPADELARFGVSEADLTAPRTGAPLRALLAFEARRAYGYYDEALALGHLVDPVGRPVLQALVGVYRALLDEIVRRDHDVVSRRVSVPLWRKAAVVGGALAGRLRPHRAGPSGVP